MDSYEATRVVFSRIQNLDPDNASKIMGLLLIQDHGEKEMIRLAFGPESVLHSVILKARKELDIMSNNSSAQSTPSSPMPFNNPLSLSRQNSSSSSPTTRIFTGATNLPSPLSIPNQSSSWASSSFSNPEDLISPGSGYANTTNGFANSSMNSSAPPFFTGGDTDLLDELQLQEQLAFLNEGGSLPIGQKNPDFFYQTSDMASSPNADSYLFPPFAAGSGTGLPHRRSCSVSDVNLGSDDPAGFGWKPCHYYARGYCKNGTSCRFVHSGFDASDGGGGGGGGGGAAMVGSPTKMEMMEQCHELLRSKSLQQQRLAAASQLMGSSPNFPYSPNKGMNYLLHQHQQPLSIYRGAAALMIGDEMHKFGRSRLERNEFAMMNPGSRQIYLTFPADST